MTISASYTTSWDSIRKKASSLANDVRLIEKRLAPRFGSKKVAEVTRAEIAAFHRSLGAIPYEANRALALLSKAFNLAEVWCWRPDGSNPCRQVTKFPEKKRKRYLGANELGALGVALRHAEAGEIGPVSPYAVAAIRLLVLTGARKGEVLGLRWSWIDFEAGRAHLPDTKTGEKALILSPPALAVLAALPRMTDNPYVIVGGRPGAALVNLKDPWCLICRAAGLKDVRIHDLRHSFASVGAASGLSLPVIGALLGHSQAATTHRYAHLADDPLRAAAAAIGSRIEAAMQDGAGGSAVLVERS